MSSKFEAFSSIEIAAAIEDLEDIKKRLPKPAKQSVHAGHYAREYLGFVLKYLAEYKEISEADEQRHLIIDSLFVKSYKGGLPSNTTALLGYIAVEFPEVFRSLVKMHDSSSGSVDVVNEWLLETLHKIRETKDKRAKKRSKKPAKKEAPAAKAVTYN